MNVIFICTANRDRSRTAEIHFQHKYPEHRFRSAGINMYLCERHGGVYVRRYMLEIADRIVCAEKVHADFIISKIDKRFADKIEVASIGDSDTFMTASLIEQWEKSFTI